MAEALAVIRVETVPEALRLFFEVAEGKEPQFDSIELGEDFSVSIKLPSYHSEVPSQFIESYHASLRRAYQFVALIENGRSDAKTLTNEQQQKYKFTVKVAEGSSLMRDNFAEMLAETGKEAFKKMTGKQATITILGTALIACSAWGFWAHVAAQKEIRLAEIQSQDRIETLKVVADSHKESVEALEKIVDIMKNSGEAANSGANVAQEILNQRLRAISETDEVEIGGETITGDQARELRTSSRRKSVQVTAVLEMRVIDVNRGDPTETVVILEDSSTGEQTKLRYSDRVTGDTFNPIVIDALANRSTAVFTLKGKMVDDEITYQEIVSVQAGSISGTDAIASSESAD